MPRPARCLPTVCARLWPQPTTTPTSSSSTPDPRRSSCCAARRCGREPSFTSPDVFAGLQESIGQELAVIDLAVASGDPAARLRGPELVVRLELMPGLDQAALDAVLARLAKRWAADDRIAVLVDSLT